MITVGLDVIDESQTQIWTRNRQ